MEKRWQAADGVHLDLRGLEPPAPMLAILKELEGGAPGPLVVHLDREPVFLYGELVERGWTWEPAAPGSLHAGGPAAGAAVTLVLDREAVR